MAIQFISSHAVHNWWIGYRISAVHFVVFISKTVGFTDFDSLFFFYLFVCQCAFVCRAYSYVTQKHINEISTHKFFEEFSLISLSHSLSLSFDFLFSALMSIYLICTPPLWYNQLIVIPMALKLHLKSNRIVQTVRLCFGSVCLCVRCIIIVPRTISTERDISFFWNSHKSDQQDQVLFFICVCAPLSVSVSICVSPCIFMRARADQTTNSNFQCQDLFSNQNQ